MRNRTFCSRQSLQPQRHQPCGAEGIAELWVDVVAGCNLPRVVFAVRADVAAVKQGFEPCPGERKRGGWEFVSARIRLEYEFAAALPVAIREAAADAQPVRIVDAAGNKRRDAIRRNNIGIDPADVRTPCGKNAAQSRSVQFFKKRFRRPRDATCGFPSSVSGWLQKRLRLGIRVPV